VAFFEEAVLPCKNLGFILNPSLLLTTDPTLLEVIVNCRRQKERKKLKLNGGAGQPPSPPLPFFFRSNRLLEAQAEIFFGAKADLRTLTQFQFFLIFNFLTIKSC
jgi:hypothetical protein